MTLIFVAAVYNGAAINFSSGNLDIYNSTYLIAIQYLLIVMVGQYILPVQW